MRCVDAATVNNGTLKFLDFRKPIRLIFLICFINMLSNTKAAFTKSTPKIFIKTIRIDICAWIYSKEITLDLVFDYALSAPLRWVCGYVTDN